MQQAREFDAERLGVLRATGLLEAGRSPSLDRLTGLAARLIGAPVALVSLVDADRQRSPARAASTASWTRPGRRR